MRREWPSMTKFASWWLLRPEVPDAGESLGPPCPFPSSMRKSLVGPQGLTWLDWLQLTMIETGCVPAATGPFQTP